VYPEAYLTPVEAARVLGVSVSLLAKLRVYGGGPVFTRVCRVVRYRRSDLDAFMEAQLTTSTSDYKAPPNRRR
jgi:excisionase family DNA binding protein